YGLGARDEPLPRRLALGHSRRAVRGSPRLRVLGRQGRLPAVRLHLAARHAAALPLRPADALRLEDAHPGGRGLDHDHRHRRDALGLVAMDQALFYAAAALAVVGALVVIGQKNPIYSAFALIVTLCSLSVIFGLL